MSGRDYNLCYLLRMPAVTQKIDLAHLFQTLSSGTSFELLEIDQVLNSNYLQKVVYATNQPQPPTNTHILDVMECLRLSSDQHAERQTDLLTSAM